MKGVIVFVKNPELGKVKTRLAATVGDKEALSIYHKLLEYTRRVLLDLKETQRFVFYSSLIDDGDDWSNANFHKYIQEGLDLGQRMSTAFKLIFEKCDKVVIIGSDCTQLKSSHINSAFDFLESKDMVIGPSHDGGYYLLGLNKHNPFLFQNIEWSSASVLKETLDKADHLNLQYTMLEELSDIDNEEDWRRYGF